MVWNMKDMTGLTFGKLLVVEKVPNPKGGSTAYWRCNCNCGGEVDVEGRRLRNGDKTHCGCEAKMIYHGKRSSNAYTHWKHIKSRCYNPNNQDYKDYGGAGILMSETFRKYFERFLDEIGDHPDDGKKYSVDRIDNTKGYVEGNIRWATCTEQARNKGGYKNNKTGVKGVYRSGNSYKSTWYDIEGKQRTKSFSVNKYGEELALFLAQEYRTTMMERLNLLGAGYTHYHIYGTEEA